MFLKNILFLIFISCAAAGWGQNSQKEKKTIAVSIHELQDSLTVAIVHDGFSPPVASRIYAYCSIAAYEGLRQVNDANYSTFSGKLNDFKLSSFKPNGNTAIDQEAVMLAAFSKVAKEMVYRDFIIDSVYATSLKRLKQRDKKDVLKASLEKGNDLADQIIAWAARDHYKETRNMPRYTPKGTDSSWAPTSPSYAQAVEPYWARIRTFVIDSAGQFKLPGVPKFGTTKGSEIYDQALQMLAFTKEIDSEREATCLYWDCNPLRTYVKGHVMFNARQLTPTGHWMAISKYASRKKGLNNMESARVYALVAITEADAFIATWHEKYKFDYIRPETYINKYIDPQWKPFLETPSFPEYASAHSTVSGAAAEVLTKLFGNEFSYADSSELNFHMNVRHYTSFKQAANEAAMSRTYGGIHYPKSCKDGITLGTDIGDLVIKRLIEK